MSWPDGRKYIGHYFEGRKHGLGSVQYSDGSSHCGTFSKGKMHGEIVYTDMHGMAKLIRYREGKPVRVDMIGSDGEDAAACQMIAGREESVTSIPSDATTETGSVCSVREHSVAILWREQTPIACFPHQMNVVQM